MLIGLSLSIIAMASEGGGGSIIDVDPGVIFWTIVTFIFLLIVLKKFAWKPILTALDQRESAIKESLEKAENAKADAQRILDENQVNLAKAELEAKKIINQSREYAEKMKEQIIDDSKKQAEKVINEASIEIKRRKESAFSDLKNQIAEIVVLAAEKIMREHLNNERQKEIVSKYITEITKN